MNKLYLELISYLENDKIGKSKEILKKIIHLNNLKSQEFLYLGIKFLNSNCLDESLICLKKSLEINPNHYSAYTNIGVIYFKKFKNYNLAIKNFKESININSNNASAYYNMGCCFEEINQINEAIESTMSYVRNINKYIENRAPWKLVKTNLDLSASVLLSAAEALRISCLLLLPIMPKKMKKILNILGDDRLSKSWNGFKDGLKIKSHDSFFPRIEINRSGSYWFNKLRDIS